MAVLSQTDAKAGKPRVVQITGGAGIGKSRLVEEFRSRIDARTLAAGR